MAGVKKKKRKSNGNRGRNLREEASVWQELWQKSKSKCPTGALEESRGGRTRPTGVLKELEEGGMCPRGVVKRYKRRCISNRDRERRQRQKRMFNRSRVKSRKSAFLTGAVRGIDERSICSTGVI